jgi:PTS system nitrogen regulatory IIA component
MHFGATLRLLRLESGLSLRDLARRLSVSGTYLSRVENGLDSVPTPARLEAIARELDIPPPLLMGLARRVSPLVVDYIQQVPDAGTLFLEIAHRRLDERQVAEVRAFLNERFPIARRAPQRSPRGFSDLLAPDRVVLRFTCAGLDDVLDVAAGRLAAATGLSAFAIGAPLKQREREIASTIGSGVAVPCVCIAGVEPLAVLVTLAAPLRYDTPDQQPLRAVVVLAGPRDSPDRRLRIAHIARLAARGMVDHLAEVDSPGEALSRVTQLELPG